MKTLWILGKEPIIYYAIPVCSFRALWIFFLGYINCCPGLVFLLASFLNYQRSKRIVSICIDLTFFGDFQLFAVVLEKSFLGWVLFCSLFWENKCLGAS